MLEAQRVPRDAVKSKKMSECLCSVLCKSRPISKMVCLLYLPSALLFCRLTGRLPMAPDKPSQKKKPPQSSNFQPILVIVNYYKFLFTTSRLSQKTCLKACCPLRPHKTVNGPERLQGLGARKKISASAMAV